MTHPAREILLEVNNLSLRRPGPEETVLDNVSLSIRAKEIVTIVGPNGSGKSTLLRSILGLMKPDVGRIYRRPALRIGYVPQKIQIDPAMPMTVSRFLSLPQKAFIGSIGRALERVGIAGLATRQMSQLSGGQFQRALLARALLQNPELLVLDEPTQGLDQPGIIAFYRLIDEVRAETGAAVLLVSHDLMIVMRASDRVICLNGHICCEGTPEHVSASPAYRALFGGGEAAETLALYNHHHDHDHHEGHHHA